MYSSVAIDMGLRLLLFGRSLERSQLERSDCNRMFLDLVLCNEFYLGYFSVKLF
jgi:hypothetical protein